MIIFPTGRFLIIIFLLLQRVQQAPPAQTHRRNNTYDSSPQQQAGPIYVVKKEKNSDRPNDKPPNKPNDKPTEKPIDKATETPHEKPANKPIDKPTDKPIDKATDKPTNKPADKPTDKIIDKPIVDKSPQNLIDRPTDRSALKADKPVDMNTDRSQSGNKPVDQPLNKSADRSGVNSNLKTQVIGCLFTNSEARTKYAGTHLTSGRQSITTNNDSADGTSHPRASLRSTADAGKAGIDAHYKQLQAYIARSEVAQSTNVYGMYPNQPMPMPYPQYHGPQPPYNPMFNGVPPQQMPHIPYPQQYPQQQQFMQMGPQQMRPNVQ